MAQEHTWHWQGTDTGHRINMPRYTYNKVLAHLGNHTRSDLAVTSRRSGDFTLILHVSVELIPHNWGLKHQGQF